FLFIFVLGLVVGSFINVCIYRIPKEESLIKPRSHCRNCNAAIKWYDNIPLISYLLLKGKCRYCKSKISLNYPIVELVTAFCFVLVANKYYQNLETFLYLYLTFVLIAVFFIDYLYQIIPDLFSYSLIIVGLIFSVFNHDLGLTFHSRLLNSFSGAITGGAVLFLMGYFGKKIFKQDAMGLGDIKFLAGIGSIFGLFNVVIILFSAAILGSIYGIILILVKKIGRRDYIPFGPFISVAAFICIFLRQSNYLFK
ncbi:MAG: prepilin peptidase, partial [Elusimicrobia bacterium]|nr:prepilin peptidase [Elusimicrobiota bacterium]